MEMSRFLLTFLFCISSLYSCECKDLSSSIKCQAGRSQLSTKGYSYKYYDWPADSSTLIVDVKGDRDANIMFSPCDGCDGYRILLGGWDNYKSFIREEGLESNEEATLVVTPGILSTEEFRTFAISVGIDAGFFKIQVLNFKKEIVMERTWKSSAMPWRWPVPFVAFSGYTQNPMLFKFCSWIWKYENIWKVGSKNHSKLAGTRRVQASNRFRDFLAQDNEVQDYTGNFPPIIIT